MPSDMSRELQFETFKDVLARRILSKPGFADDPAELDD